MTDTTLTLGVHSIMLGVADIDASISFYTAQLGFTLQTRFEDFAFIDAGGTTITLSGELARARPPGTPGSFEIVLAVESVRTAYDVLRARGVAFSSTPHTVDGTNDVANFNDPDGHVLSLYGPP